MSKPFPRVLDSRYVHTGNSGVTIAVSRSEKLPDRADLCISFGAMGSTDMTLVSRGSNMKGYTAQQLRDLATVLLRSAYELERPAEDQWFESPDLGSPRILLENLDNGNYSSDELKQSAEILREKGNELLRAIHAVRSGADHGGLSTSDYLGFYRKEWTRGAREERMNEGYHQVGAGITGEHVEAEEWGSRAGLLPKSSKSSKTSVRKTSRRIPRNEEGSS